jgi:hypothetical protein
VGVDRRRHDGVADGADGEDVEAGGSVVGDRDGRVGGADVDGEDVVAVGADDDDPADPVEAAGLAGDEIERIMRTNSAELLKLG